ncbi:MAG: hypothetical protein DMG96_38010 [Acidobacteria bacterium]|nr:MAG: hypothetical protein DMG96_38010 [Acidobacteriota bacterium]
MRTESGLALAGGREQRERALECGGFHIASSLRVGICGAGSVETTAGEEWVGTAERDQSIPKAGGVKANRTLDAVSDGAFAATHHDLPAKFQPFTS